MIHLALIAGTWYEYVDIGIGGIKCKFQWHGQIIERWIEKFMVDGVRTVIRDE
jgi:hypothetical protein